QELILPNPQNLTMLATLNDASEAVATVAEPPQPVLIADKTTQKTKITAEKSGGSTVSTLKALPAEPEQTNIVSSSNIKAASEVKEAKEVKEAQETKTSSNNKNTKEMTKQNAKVAQTTTLTAEPVAMTTAPAASETIELAQQTIAPASKPNTSKQQTPKQETPKPAPKQKAKEPSLAAAMTENAPVESINKTQATVAQVTQLQTAIDAPKEAAKTLSLEEKKMTTAQLRAELKAKLIEELKEELKAELQAELVAAFKEQKAARLQKEATVVASNSAQAVKTKEKTDAVVNAKTQASTQAAAKIDAPAASAAQVIAKASNKVKTEPKAELAKPSENLATQEASKSAAIASSAIEHVIASGESLWGIARKYQVSYQDLLAWNELNAQSVIIPGKKLLINVSSAQKVASAKSEPTQKTPLHIEPAESAKPIELALVN
ncbi:MAG: LysM peptidoglycan-binding domain-containing protein, partial [Enterovibrio sp.]